MSSIHKLCLCLIPTLFIGCGDSSDDTSTDQSSTGGAAVSTDTIPAVVPDEERGFETPAIAFHALTKARTDKDFAVYVGAMPNSSQQAIAGGTIFGLGMMAAFDESLRDDVTAILDKHGMSDPNSLSKPPSGITKHSTRIEQLGAMGAVFHNPAAFIVDARNFISQQSGGKNDSDVGSGELGPVTIDGETATAQVKHRRGRKTIKFRRTATGWLVHLTDDQFSTNSGKTVSGSGKLDQFGMRDRNPAELPPVEPITVAEVQNAWKVSVDYQEQPAITALQDITQKCGLTIYDQPDFADTLKQNVTVKLEDASPLEVIEAVCSQVELHPRYKAGAMALNKGPRTLPIVFAGPFLIEATETQELVPNAFGKIKFQCFAASLPAAVSSRLAGRYVQTALDPKKLTFEIPELKGGDGSALESRFRSFFPANASKSSVQARGEVDVVQLLRSVENIAEFDGSISWSFPQKIEAVLIEQLEKDATTKAGDATITITSVNVSDRSSSIGLKLVGLTHNDLLVVARDGSGAVCKKNVRVRILKQRPPHGHCFGSERDRDT